MTVDIKTLESEAKAKGFKSLGAYVDYYLDKYGSWDQEEVAKDENSGND